VIELVLIVCLAQDPDQCKDVYFSHSEEFYSAMQCVMQGQPQIARWISNNPPIWRVKRWYCTPVGRRLKDI